MWQVSPKAKDKGLQYLGFPKLTSSYKEQLILCQRGNTMAITVIHCINENVFLGFVIIVIFDGVGDV